ncbi:MAG: bifunctional UDP-N-acetylglucosamine diphosphorylase/glucosamine-1-phosphate N-acetyltransferase GlmU [Arenicellales bacterium]
MTLEVIILAAGKGTRMRSALPKVLHDLAGRPLIQHVLDTARELSPDRIHVVHGHGAELVRQRLAAAEDINWVEQAEQLGTGHAVSQALPDVNPDARVLVLYGDVPLIRAKTLRALLDQSGDSHPALLTAELNNPSGYGRILRDGKGAVTAIVEEADASQAERQIGEINTGFMACPAGQLQGWLEEIDNSNRQGEFYLTDVVGRAAQAGATVTAVGCQDPDEITGVNSQAELAKVERCFQARQAEVLMEAGLGLRDPARFDLRGSLSFGEDCVFDINVVVSGEVHLGKGVSVGPNCQIIDSEIGNGVEVRANSVVEGVKIADHCAIGPFARLRPGTVLNAGARVGNFVETKNTTLGEDSKANHLAYVGDATVGQRVNIGAGVITCNYDGANKHPTVIEDDAFVGSNSALVAPVTIGKGATVGAGSAVSRDVPPGQLALTRAEQQVRSGWQRPKKEKKN